jgi:putative alpha-1,2-mannosidase
VATQQRHLDIIALGTGPHSVYVDQVTLNNAPVSGAIVEDGPLQGDAVLRFIMRGTASDVLRGLYCYLWFVVSNMSFRVFTAVVMFCSSS